MIVTASESGYIVEHENGMVETTIEIPDSFTVYQNMMDGIRATSKEFSTLKKKTGLKFDELDDFRELQSILEQQELSMRHDHWYGFYMTVLWQLDYLLHSSPIHASNPSEKEDPIWTLIRTIAKILAIHWRHYDSRLGSSMFDYNGIKQYLRKLDTLEDRIDFLSAIETEMRRPCGINLIDFNEDQSPSEPHIWYIQLEYRHALYPTDMSRVRELRTNWQDRYPTEVLRETGFAIGHMSQDNRANESAISESSQSKAPLLNARQVGGITESEPKERQQKVIEEQDRRLKWTGGQMDLVYLIDRLKAVGLLAPATTDADIIEHFDFDGTAGDMEKTYRNIRGKVKYGTSHPNRQKYGILVSLFLDRVTALPIPEDLHHLLISPNRANKR